MKKLFFRNRFFFSNSPSIYKTDRLANRLKFDVDIFKLVFLFNFRVILGIHNVIQY